MSKMSNKINNKTIGVIYALLAFALWGVLPLYWKLLKEVSAEEILANRILWSFVFVGVLMSLFKQWDKFILILKSKKNLKLIFLCSIMITINWFTYIWAVNNDHIVDTSLGYYINPLFAVFLGVTVLKEKINKIQAVSLLLAAVGVILITIQHGKIPWIALTLAISFGLYGLFKKMLTVDSMTGLTLETTILMPVALVYVLFKQFTGAGALGTGSILTTVMLIGAGIVTATPLLCFAKAAKRVELSTIGFLQYISPTIGLVLGILVFKENFTSNHLVSFGFIWLALITYSFSNTNFKKKPLNEALEEAN
jgi:chloramphenicol-sensitive protein RarD